MSRTKAAQTTAPVKLRTLYSYRRWSTGEQGDGNSNARQGKPLDSFLKAHPEWRLSSDEFLDQGRSGSKGVHLGRKGQLGRFLSLIEAGVIEPGSGLAIENWDRLSRMPIDKSLDLVRAILKKGVAIVLVPTGEVFEPAGLSDPMVWTRLVWEFERAYREGHRRAEYARDNWERKRVEVQDRRIVSAWCPFWLTVWQDGKAVGKGRGKLDLDRGCEYRENDGAAVVREVFRLADTEDMGAFRICGELARRGVKFRRAETLTMATVVRLLTNPAVLGVYTPHLSRDKKGKRVVAGEPVEGYYPAVVDREVFDRVQVRLGRRKKAGRGRKGSTVANLFQGVLFEVESGSPMYLKCSRPGQEQYVSKASMRGLSARTVEYPVKVFERAVLRVCRELSPSLLTPRCSASETVKRCESELLALVAKIDREQKRYDDARTVAEEEVANTNLTRLQVRKRELERERDTAAAELSTSPADQLRQLQRLVDVLDSTPAEELAGVRSTIRGVITSLISRIEVYVQKKGKPRREVKRAWVRVRYVSGLERLICIHPDGKIATLAAPTDFEAVVSQAKKDDGWK